MRANAKEVWRDGFDRDAMQAANTATLAAAKDARARGVEPTSAEAKKIIETFFEGLAHASGHRVDEKFRAGARARFARQDPRVARYWELNGILRGASPMAGHIEEWKWIVAAVLHHVPEG